MLERDALIEVRDLTKRYGGVVALADMNLTVERGTIHAVVGENGAGKSTLMKILAGAVRPDSGDDHDRRRDGDDRFAATRRGRRGIGIVYQELSLFPERSVLANLLRQSRAVAPRASISTRTPWRTRAATCSPGSACMSTSMRRSAGSRIGERQLVELCPRPARRAAAASSSTSPTRR